MLPSRLTLVSKSLTDLTIALVLLSLSACGGTFVEGASCNEHEVSLQLLTPSLDGSLGMEIDESPEPGLQTTIVVQTDLASGSLLTLSQLLESGVSLLHDMPGTVQDDGSAVFEAVTLVEGENNLRIHAEGHCNWFAYEEAISVQGAPSCNLDLPIITRNGVNYLSKVADRDEVVPGAQVEARLIGLPGARVSLIHDEEGILLRDTGIGESGSVAVELNLQEGPHELQIECSLDEEERTLLTTRSLLVDTTAPECELIDFIEGSNITRTLDEDPEHDGTQVSIEVFLGESGLAAEDILLSVTHDGQELSVAPIEVLPGDRGKGQVTFWGPGINLIDIKVSDAAGNQCQSSVSVNYLAPD